MKLFIDDYSNYATIEKKSLYPYKGANKKKPAYILKCYSVYNNDQLYFCSIYSTLTEAKEKLSGLSCGTFKESKRSTKA